MTKVSVLVIEVSLCIAEISGNASLQKYISETPQVIITNRNTSKNTPSRTRAKSKIYTNRDIMFENINSRSSTKYVFCINHLLI